MFGATNSFSNVLEKKKKTYEKRIRRKNLIENYQI